MPAKTEKAKMLAGEVYNCLDPELVAMRQHTKMLFRSFNSVAEDVVSNPARIMEVLEE